MRKRWERVKEAYDLLVHGKGKPSTNVVQALQESYDEGVSDEFVKPVVMVDENGHALGTIQEGDVVIFINFRNDRARELTIVHNDSMKRAVSLAPGGSVPGSTC